jgi:hypothetical protein
LLSDSNSVIRPPNPYEADYERNRIKDGEPLPFVNRESELTTAWTALARNLQQSGHDPTFMIVIGQMFGSGKSEFGRNLFNFKDQRIKRLFDECFVNRPYHREMLRETRPVSIDLELEHSPGHLDLPSWVSEVIFVATLMQCFGVDKPRARQFWLDAGQPKGDVCAVLLHSFVMKPLFFHFDEIGALEKLFPQLMDANEPKKIYYDFWSATIQFQKMGCWVYLSGKVLHLVDFGNNAKTCPGTGCNIQLALFRQKDVRDIIWESESNKPTSIGVSLMIPNVEKANELAGWLFKMTTGVPRYVQYALHDYMIVETLKQGRYINWLASPEDGIMYAMKKAPGFPLQLNSTASPGFVHLFKLAVIGRLLPNTAVYQSQTLVELAAYHGFYVTTLPNHPHHIKLVIPRLWTRELKMSGTEADDLKSICQLPSTDKGKIFERHIEERILLTSNYPPGETLSASKAFPFLTGSMIQDQNMSDCVLLEMNKARKGNRLSLVEQMMSKSSGCVLVRPADNSATPDLMTLLPTQTDGKRYLIGWQMKNLPNSFFTASLLWEEIDKFSAILSARVCHGGVFVMVLNGNGDTFVERYRGKVLKVVSSESKSDDSNTIAHPDWTESAKSQPRPPLEVVILNQDDLQAFVGEYNLEYLSTAGEDGHVSG